MTKEPEKQLLTTNQYDHQNHLGWLLWKANKKCEGYVIDDYNTNIHNDLLEYFNGVSNGLNNSKGILLIGEIGTGKTFIMELFQDYLRKAQSTKYYLVKDVFSLATQYEQEGADTLNRYMLNGGDPYHVCFDDIGMERKSLHYYGAQGDVLQDLLIQRYKLFTRYNTLTHATTNLDIESLKKRYGERLIDRFKEMFNVVILRGGSRRK